MYSDIFSRVYDKFGWNYYPEFFSQILEEWISQEKLTVRSMLDIGCGTGVLAHLMKEKGIESAGMDLSEGMIRVAKENYPDIPFEVGNMITYMPQKQYDLVTATCDALNHILKEEDVQQVFSHVFAYTSEGGRFLFDLLRAQEARECEPVEIGELDGEAVWYSIHQNGEYVTLRIDIRRGDRLCHTEEIHERIYDPWRIQNMLLKAGFSKVTVTDRLLEGSEPAATWFVIAQKSGPPA